MTPLALLNFLVLQWFGVRLARSRARCDVRNEWRMPIGSRCLFVHRDQVHHSRVVEWCDGGEILQWYSLLRWVWPLTGWWSDFRWIARRG
jgi:hypothetical protein